MKDLKKKECWKNFHQLHVTFFIAKYFKFKNRKMEESSSQKEDKAFFLLRRKKKKLGDIYYFVC